MKKHFVTFYSPGTFVAETTQKPIKSWDVGIAVEMAKGIKERHGAIPYGFAFSTRERTSQDLDSKETKRSGMYFLHGKIQTLQEIKNLNDPQNRILISNMECNKWDRVITTTEGYTWTLPFNKEDTLVDQTKLSKRMIRLEK